MNTLLASQILKKELDAFEMKSWSALADLIDTEPITFIKIGPDEKEYQIEINMFWDNIPNKDIRVIGSIDDGGIRAYFPHTNDFIKAKETAPNHPL
jgi:hypothetical protein